MTQSLTDRQLALYAALAISVHLIEAGIPSPLPGVKPGLANVVALVVLLRHGVAAAAWVTGLRVVGGSLLLGTFLGPSFILAAAGGVAAVAMLALLHTSTGTLLGPVGYAVPAAIAHTAAQLAVARLLFIPDPGLWQLAPVLFAFAVAAGITTGIIAAGIIARLPPRHDAS
ncbi:MAG: Gx transporter family protein [Xanthomonadaceae bacterium]|nr:Gx transporter family protein [Xanthomonadaceae bacterium]